MPAFDFTAFPSKPAAPPAVSAGAPRPTARAGAPVAGPKTGSKAGSKTGGANAANDEFGSLVDRLADAPDEGQASSPRGVIARGSRDAAVIGEESAAEPRAKGDADEASGAANDASAANTSMASNPLPFPWTLPLSPSLWVIEPVKAPEENAGGDTLHGEGEGEGDGVPSAIAGAAAGAIVDGAAAACLATLPVADAGAESATSTTSTTLSVPVDAPIAIDPALTFGAASTASTTAATSANGAQDAKDAGAIDASEAFDAAWAHAAALGANAAEAAAGANANTNTNSNTNAAAAGDDLLAAGVTNGAFESSELIAGESTIDQSVIDALNARTNSANNANNAIAPSSSNPSTDSTLLAPSATDSATTAAAVDHAAATTAAGQSDPANAAPEAPAPGDQAREQALIELQRVFDAARASASPATAKPLERNPEAPIVLHMDAQAGNAANDATASANGAAHQSALEAVANAGKGSNANGSGALTGEAGADPANASTSASGQTSRARDAQETLEDTDVDGELTGASSWASAAAAKYAEAAGAGTSGGDTRESGSNADAALNSPHAGRGSSDAPGSNASPIAFDARVMGASRANEHSALHNGSAGESAVVTTAPPEEQAAQIVKSMRLQWRGANGEATLRLQPDHLGQVFVSVRVEQGTVSATVRAETAAAQQWIQQNQQQLRDALDAQGLRVAQFYVTTNPDDRPRRDQEQEPQDKDSSGRRSSRARARRTDDDRRFEIHL